MLLSGRRNLRWLAGAALLAWTASGWSAGLGSMEVLSSLGQQLRVNIALTDYNPSDGVNCVRATLRSLDGGLVATPRAALLQSGRQSWLQLTTRERINEPAVSVSISLGCDASLHRQYQILLDPVLTPPVVTRAEPVAPPVVEKRVRRTPPPRVAVTPPEETVIAEAPRRRKAARKEAAITPVAPAENSAVAAASQEPAQPPKPKKKKLTRSERSVLRLSAATLAKPLEINPDTLANAANPDTENEPVATTMQLRRADSLTLPLVPTDPARMAELQAEQEKFAALMRDEDPVQSIQESMRKLKGEMESVRAETARMRDQSQADKAALATLRTDSMHWIGGLGWLLLVCLGAIAWLTWRLAAAKNAASRAEWAALVAARNTQMPILQDEDEFAVAEPALSEPAVAAPVAAQPERAATPPVSPPEAPAPAAASRENGAALATSDQAPAPDNITVRTLTDPDEQIAKAAPTEYDRTGLPPYMLLRSVRAVQAARREDHTMKVAEISDVVELAEAWMALNDPHKVLELLDPFSAVEHPESPLPWLCLLEVYRTLGQQEKYEAILERIKSRFNVKLAPWNNETDFEPPKTLADYPHISENIVRLWPNTAEVVAYLEQLQRDNRQGTRNGFDLPVYRDILKLISLAEHADRSSGQAVMSERAHAILFPGPKPAAAPAPAPAATAVTAASAPKPVLRTRPKYITTAYQRVIQNEGGAAARPDPASAQPAAAPAPASQPAAAPKAAVAAAANPAPQAAARPAAAATAPARNWPAIPGTPAGAVKSAAVPQPAEEPKKIAEIHEDLCPVGVKLHLAVAYHDIGDKEGAYVLLDEVVKEGTAAQIEQAKKLMAKLGV